MNKTQEAKLKQLASELALDIKTGADLSALSAKLVKLTVEAALSAELENHLGYAPHSTLGHHSVIVFKQAQYSVNSIGLYKGNYGNGR